MSVRRDDPSSVRRDLGFLWIDVRFAHSAMKHKPDPGVVAASSSEHDVTDRIETELAGEATRYRHALYACVAVCLMPFVLAGVAWSALYWLPVRVRWFPFDIGYYGLPWMSLYEWVAYLLLALFFLYGFMLVAESHSATSRLSADYHRLADADEAGRRAFAETVRREGLARTALLMRSSAVFAAYASLLDAAGSGASDAAVTPSSEAVAPQ